MGMPERELPLPPYYDPKNAERWEYGPDHLDLFRSAEEWRRRYEVAASGSDSFRLHLLLIDVQKDFCFPQGALYVGGRSGSGAMDDSKRISEFIYRNAGTISDITATLDTHFAYQIFFPWFFVDENDRALSPHTMIRIEDGDLVNIDPSGKLLHKKVRPNPAMAGWLCKGDYAWLCEQTKFYCDELARENKYTLYLWPPHCLLGSDGYGLAGVVHEARIFHAFLRCAQSRTEVKGGHPLTENYSILRPEVLMGWDGHPLAEENTRFWEELVTADAVVVAGQAASHCVKSSIEDLLQQISKRDPGLAKKIYILKDCMSSVVVRDEKGEIGLDFTPQTEEAHRKFEKAGMHIVKSTDPIESWEGLGSVVECN